MNKNEQQKAIFVGSVVVLSVSLVISKFLEVKNSRIKAENAEKARVQHEKNMESLGKLRDSLDKQLNTARFWEIVTRDI